MEVVRLRSENRHETATILRDTLSRVHASLQDLTSVKMDVSHNVSQIQSSSATFHTIDKM
jgi:hypothetical protein